MPMNLQQFMFPVTERQVAVDNQITSGAKWKHPDTFLPSSYKAIVREDTNEVISIVKDSYQLVSNESLIKELLDQLVRLSTSFKIDPTHSFVQNERMRLQVTFPELRMKDSESDIALSLFVHNSYDQSEGVRMYFGAIRSICSNGMVFGDVMAKMYHRHTKGFELSQLKQKLEEAIETFPIINHRIRQLERTPVNKELVENIEKHVSKRLAQQFLDEMQYDSITQWKLFNMLTYHVSHDMEQHKRARYQQQLSKVFAL
jgi:hypothetical protein